jgi:hypothetical protein
MATRETSQVLAKVFAALPDEASRVTPSQPSSPSSRRNWFIDFRVDAYVRAERRGRAAGPFAYACTARVRLV